MADELSKLRNDVNRGPNRGLEIRLGVIQVVALLGAVLGCMFGAFYLGFLSGRTVGFEVARTSSTSEVAKLPIPILQQESDSEPTESDPSRIYAKLHETARMGDADSAKPNDKTGAININPPNIKDLPNQRDLDSQDADEDLRPPDTKATKDINSVFEREATTDANSALAREQSEAPNQVAETQPTVRVLGGDSKTLGMLLDERLEQARKSGDTAAQKKSEEVAVAPTLAPKAQPSPTPRPQPTTAPTPQQSADNNALQNVKGVLPGGWYAQVAAPKKLPEAQQIARTLKKAGFAVLIENAHVRGEDYYRVVVGPEDGRVQADRLVEQLKRESSLSAQPFVRRVR